MVTHLRRVAAGLVLLVGLSAPGLTTADAHPGNTDSAGCHTCRTNCPSWGRSYGEYHCHNPRSSSPPPSAPAAAPPPPPAPRVATTAEVNSVRRLYFAYFTRDADPSGQNYWSHLHANGHSLTSISDHFAESAEFKARYGTVTDVEFITLLYRNVLNREPDQSGLEYWLGKLREGRTRGWLMAAVSESSEFRIRTGIA